MIYPKPYSIYIGGLQDTGAEGLGWLGVGFRV